jgi:hypothetical protein
MGVKPELSNCLLQSNKTSLGLVSKWNIERDEMMDVFIV